MGLATIDRHSHEAHTKLYKIPKCGIIDLIVTKIQPFENKLQSVRMPQHFFVMLMCLNGCISVKTGLINTKLGDFVNFGVLF